MSEEKEILPRDESEATEDEAKVIKQCEFYFSDSNLPRDKFLRKTVKEGKGWVSLSVLATFNRLKALVPGHETNEARGEALGAILRKSKELLVVSKDNFVKRTAPVDPSAREKSTARSLCVHGLPTDSEVTNIASVTKFFTEQGATVHFVKLLTVFDKEKKLKARSLSGTALVELKDVAEMESFLGQELKWEGAEEALKVEKLIDYNERKKSENGDKESGKKRKGEQTEDGEEPEESKASDILKDRLIKLSGLASEEGEDEDKAVSRESISELLATQGKATVAFVSYQRGEDTAIVRLENDSEVGAAEAVKAINDANLELNGKVRKIEALSGEAEEEELKSIENEKMARRKAKSGKGGRGGKGGKGGKRGPGGKASKKRQKTG